MFFKCCTRVHQTEQRTAEYNENVKKAGGSEREMERQKGRKKEKCEEKRRRNEDKEREKKGLEGKNNNKCMPTKHTQTIAKEQKQ